MPVYLLVALLAGERNLVGVDNDHAVPMVNVRRVIRRASSRQRPCRARCEATQNPTLSIDQSPSDLPAARFRKIRRQSTLHRQDKCPRVIFLLESVSLCQQTSRALWSAKCSPCPDDPGHERPDGRLPAVDRRCGFHSPPATCHLPPTCHLCY